MPPLRIAEEFFMIRRELVVELDVPACPADPLRRFYAHVVRRAGRSRNPRKVGRGERIQRKKFNCDRIEAVLRDLIAGERSAGPGAPLQNLGGRVVYGQRLGTGLPAEGEIPSLHGGRRYAGKSARCRAEFLVTLQPKQPECLVAAVVFRQNQGAVE